MTITMGWMNYSDVRDDEILSPDPGDVWVNYMENKYIIFDGERWLEGEFDAETSSGRV